MKNSEINCDQGTRQKLIKTAAKIAFIGNLILAILKIWAGYSSGSLSVLGDGIDSATDVLIAGMALVVSYIISRPSDKEHPWGHGRAETTATMVLSFVIFFAGAQLFIAAVKNIMFSSVVEQPDTFVLFVTVISIFGKVFLSCILYFFGKKASSSITLANAQNMKNDIIISVSVLIGLLLSHFLSFPLIDSIIALLVGLWVIKNAIHLFLEMNMELMDGNKNKDVYKTLFSVVKKFPEISNPHKVRIRKIASLWDIDIDIEIDANMTVHEAHKIADRLEAEIKKCISDVYDIVIHIEPAGHLRHHRHEQYGLKESDIVNE